MQHTDLSRFFTQYTSLILRLFANNITSSLVIELIGNYQSE